MNRAEKLVLKCFDDFLAKKKGTTVSLVDLTYWAHNKRLNWKDAFKAVKSLQKKGEIYQTEIIYGRTQHLTKADCTQQIKNHKKTRKKQ